MLPERPGAATPATKPATKAGSRGLRTRVWSAGRLLLLVGALSATFFAFFLTSMRVATRAREVKVPDLRGHSVEEATSLLMSSGLVLRVDARRADAKVAADHVLSQEPEAGTVVRRQRPIRVRVSDGQRDPLVPSVVGQAERTAEVVLAQGQVAIGDRAEIRTAAYETGMIVSQDPLEKNRAAKVSLLVNRGEHAGGFVMPDLIGTPGVRVVDLLRRHGLRVTIAGEVVYPGLPAGVVVRQTPQAGFQIDANGSVTIEVSR